MYETYYQGLAEKTGQVFLENPTLYDHREQYPWLKGALGNPESGICFIAENPSLTQVERVSNPDGGLPSEEAQWWSSTGDKLFRKMLLANGFKKGTIDSPDGWECYITNVVKEAQYVNTKKITLESAEIWANVLKYELKTIDPILVIILGGSAEKLLNHLASTGKIKLPATIKIKHYSFLGQRADGKLKPMHPDRIQRYSEDFASIRREFNSLKEK
jgi:uracil-DNA glycosylase